MVQKEALQDFEVAAKDLEKAELKKYGVSPNKVVILCIAYDDLGRLLPSRKDRRMA